MPTNPELLKMPLARDGEKNSIPETTGTTTGLFSQQYGFQNINSLPLTAGGKAISRLDYNGTMYLLSNLLFYAQRGYTFVYDDSMPYVVGCVVIDPNDGKKYVCTADVAAGVGVPSQTPANWIVVPDADLLGYRKPDTEYSIGDIAFNPGLPTGYYLECTTAGTTSSGALSTGGGITLNDVLTDGTAEWTVRVYRFDFPRFGAFNKKETFTSSGTFTAPVSGVYRITLQGGGGGGGGAGRTSSSGNVYKCGSGGGQGGHLEFFETLTAGNTYSYTVGAGGTAGAAGSSTTNGGAGGDGGATTITIGANSYSGDGGKGSPYGDQNIPGKGGTSEINGVSIGRTGAAGMQGEQTTVAHYIHGGSGGGQGGGNNSTGSLGGGGAGGNLETSAFKPGFVGGDGYIIFEYCDVI